MQIEGVEVDEIVLFEADERLTEDDVGYGGHELFDLLVAGWEDVLYRIDQSREGQVFTHAALLVRPNNMDNAIYPFQLQAGVIEVNQLQTAQHNRQKQHLLLLPLNQSHESL